MDYLLKPVAAERLSRAVDRARERIERGTTQPGFGDLVEHLRQRPRYLMRLPVRARAR